MTNKCVPQLRKSLRLQRSTINGIKCHSIPLILRKRRVSAIELSQKKQGLILTGRLIVFKNLRQLFLYWDDLVTPPMAMARQKPNSVGSYIWVIVLFVI